LGILTITSSMMNFLFEKKHLLIPCSNKCFLSPYKFLLEKACVAPSINSFKWIIKNVCLISQLLYIKRGEICASLYLISSLASFEKTQFWGWWTSNHLKCYKEFSNCPMYFVEISEFQFVCRDSWELKYFFTCNIFSLIVLNANKFYFEIFIEEKRLI
jgi:hypothetical protein